MTLSHRLACALVALSGPLCGLSSPVLAQEPAQQSAPISTAASAPASAPIVAPAAASAPASFADRDDVRQFMQELVTRDGFDANDVQLAFSQVQSLPRVIDLIKPPENPGVRSWQRYRARFIEPTRIRAGVQFWNDNRAALEAAESRFGVPAEIIVGIIGVETIYGRNTGSFNTLSALSTLAFDYPPRADLFRRELEALFLLARNQGRNPLDYKGSYAGALGLPQFLPSSVMKFAVDFDGNGVIELTASPADAIGSVASFLAEHGWQRGARVVLPAKVSEDADLTALNAGALQPAWSGDDLARQGVSPTGMHLALDERAAVIDLVTPGQKTEYWLGLQNFYAITRYNHSSFYAMAVHDLALAVRRAREAPVAEAATRVHVSANARSRVRHHGH